MPLSKTNPFLNLNHNPNPAPADITNPKHRANIAARTTISTRDIDSRSSSGQIWAEDYCEFEERKNSGESDTAVPQLPPAATLTSRPFPKSIPLSAEEESYPARQPRTQQRSLTALLPFSRSPERREESPQKVDIEGDFMATLTGDKEGVIKIADKTRGGLSSWFTGSSAPVTVGVPNMDDTAISPRDASPDRQPKLKKAPTSPATPIKTNTGGMFNFFSPKTPSKQQTVQIPADLNDDEFLTLDVTAALFPTGHSSASDPFSPAAFKNLLMNAEGLLLKLQTAYKIRTLSLHELSAEKEAMGEEIEEAETRAKCLKSQLEDMAHQVSMKDAAIAELAQELAAEKRARAEEELAREQSIALVKARAEKRGSNLSVDTTGEDLGISMASPERRRKRISDGGSCLSTEEESDAESGSADSVFSRSRSPAFTMSSVSVAGTIESTPEIMQASFGRMVPNPGHNSGRPPLTRQKSTFQKILSGMAAPEEKPHDSYAAIGMAEEGCGNCRGKDASVAWDAVGLMRAENRGLKERVEGLERAVDGALDLCYGLV